MILLQQGSSEKKKTYLTIQMYLWLPLKLQLEFEIVMAYKYD